MENTSNNLSKLVSASLMTTITIIFSWITIPLPFTPVPINLATLAVFVSGGLLGKKYGTLSQFVYVLCGAFGLPVFAGFCGGTGVIAGPTGGFIAGYIVCAFVIGLISDRIKASSSENNAAIVMLFLTITLGMILCYALGMAWFMFTTGSSLKAGLLACVIPFIPGDIIKIVVSVIIIKKLRKLPQF